MPTRQRRSWVVVETNINRSVRITESFKGYDSNGIAYSN